MRLEQKQVNLRTSGLGETEEFTMNLDGMMFDNMINGIYSNKIAAPIREYATNARDGHAILGKLDVPFDVELPTHGMPTFSVRDYGCSMDHETVLRTFSVLGKSTKRDDDIGTGCLGLGSKSAFAYTNTFNITCWLNGEKRDYTAYVGPAGKPLISLVSSIRSNEPQGIRISFAVQAADIDDFNSEASKQLQNFRPVPNIKRKNGQFSLRTDDEIIIDGGDEFMIYNARGDRSYRRYGQRDGKPIAVQGSVSYPIDSGVSALRKEIQAYGQDRLELLDHTDLVLFCPIGSLSHTTSREELGYDEKTCKAIAQRVDTAFLAVRKSLDDSYKDCDSMHDARVMRAEDRNNHTITSIESILNIRDRRWHGDLIYPQTQLRTRNGITYDTGGRGYNDKDHNTCAQGEFRMINNHKLRNKAGSFKASFSFGSEDHDNNLIQGYANSMNMDVVVYVKDKMEAQEAKENNRLRRFWNDIATGNSVWLRVENMAQAETWLKKFFFTENDADVTYLHELEDLKMPSKAKGAKAATTVDKKDVRVMRLSRWGSNRYGRCTIPVETVDINVKEVRPVVFFKKNVFYFTMQNMEDEEEGMDEDRMSQVLYQWTNEDSKIFVINASTKSFYEENKSSFTNAREWVMKKWQKEHPNRITDYNQASQAQDSSNSTNYAKAIISWHGGGVTVPEYLLDKANAVIADEKKKSKSTGFSLPPFYAEWAPKDFKKMEDGLTKLPIDTSLSDLIQSNEIVKEVIQEGYSYYHTSSKNKFYTAVLELLKEENK